MKIFILDRKAYHTLENIHHISISESGHSVQSHDSRVRYFITLDKNEEHWIYYRYERKRNDVGDFILNKKPARCAIHAGFDQVSKFNHN